MKVRRRPVEYTAVRFDPADRSDVVEECTCTPSTGRYRLIRPGGNGKLKHIVPGDHIVASPGGGRLVVSAEEFEREWEIVPDGLCDDIEARFGKLFEPT